MARTKKIIRKTLALHDFTFIGFEPEYEIIQWKKFKIVIDVFKGDIQINDYVLIGNPNRKELTVCRVEDIIEFPSKIITLLSKCRKPYAEIVESYVERNRIVLNKNLNYS